MPKIQWTDLPNAIREHLLDRAREREVSFSDLYALKLWRESEPEAPEGEWYKDFGSFKLCGEGKYPRHSCCEDRSPKARSSDKHSELK